MIIQSQTGNRLQDHLDQQSASITMYYDDTCVLCSTEAYNMHERNPTGIKLVPVDEGMNALKAAGFSRTDAMTYLCVQDSNDNWYTHMDAIRLLYKTGGLRWAPLLYLPVIKQLGDFAYPYVARNRYRIPNWTTKLIYGKSLAKACENGICKVAPDKR
ncbi:thiol-disulfide oxidoreductase DCC family protein [uncultured Psychrobacter sp.]|uniref:thiol-disulfide oxidoreductase DCC family protein n=1 Tax=uncultured Psychrobacter sp. TaxID=259303 RepID=UPI00345AE859